MLDIKFIRENSDAVKSNMNKKYLDSSSVDKLIILDERWRKLKFEIDNLKHERNKISERISAMKKDGKDISNELKEASAIPKKIETIEKEMGMLHDKIKQHLSTIPNMMHPDVPKGKDENDNVEVRRVGLPKTSGFELKNHVELAEELNIANFDTARKVSGHGFNYLLGDLALLDHALQRYGLDFIQKRGFSIVVPPMMLRREAMEGAAVVSDFDEVIYKVENENLYLIGTSEHSLVAMFKDELLKKDKLPIKVCALTPCFRKEVGAHGIDQKGLYRMHQFNKVEQVAISNQEDSYNITNDMLKISEEFFQSLGLPYRVIEICSGDLGHKFARQYDIEVWMPRQDGYREVTSAGNVTDYQANALNIRYVDGIDKKHVHIINNTMVATSRAMVAILENYQQKDGTVIVPDVLVPYMYGKKIIEKNVF